MDYMYEQWNEYPLRILVPSDAVGAIIGKQGSIVKQIKQTTQTKVDINKSTSSLDKERVIVIQGQMDNCVQACREILRIMYADAKAKNKTAEIVLKILAHNDFIGRIIGKGGNIINTIKKETETNVTVSSINELNVNNFERVISVKGELDQQIGALDVIYKKLCAAFESDQTRQWVYPTGSILPFYQPQQQQQLMQYIAQQATLMPNQYPTSAGQNGNSNSAPNSNGYYQNPPYQATIFPTANPFYLPYPATSPMNLPFVNQPYSNGNYASTQTPGTIPVETVHLYVPNSMVGCIIGSKGLFIKSIMKNSNASVKVSPVNPDEDQSKIVDREIVICGTPEAQWKSQYYIFEKLRLEGYSNHDDGVRLRAEVSVPTSLIGRLIGKGGQNVRQLQQSTGATIKLPEDSQQTTASEIAVQIIGNFQASQFAQRRIQSIIQQSRDFNQHDSNGNQNSNNVDRNESQKTDDAVVATSPQPITVNDQDD